MKRIIQRFLAIALLTPFIALVWLTMTESGLHWVHQRAESYLPAGLAINKLEGRLIGPILIKGVQYQHNGTIINADRIQFDWQPGALLATEISINQLHVQSLNIVLSQTTKTDQGLTLPEINLPWRMSLRNVVANEVNIHQNDQSFDIQQIQLAATTFLKKIDISKLSINTNTVSLNLEGGLWPAQNYRHKLAIRWQTTLLSHDVIKGSGQVVGDMEMTRIDQHLDGPLQLTLKADVKDLLDQIQWQGKVDVAAIDSSKLNADWPRFKGKLKLDGKGNLATATLSGTFNGDYSEFSHTLDAKLNLQMGWSDHGLDVARFDLHSSDSYFNAHGQAGETLKLDWTLNANNFAELYPGAKGQLHAKGHITGTVDNPIANASITGKELSLPNYDIAAINGEVNVDLLRWQSADIKLNAQTLNLNGYALKSLDINAKTKHLRAKAVSNAATMLIEIEGEPQPTGWRGIIKRADIQSHQFADWKLKTPVVFNISEQYFNIETLCWHHSQNANLCTSLERKNNVWLSSLELTKLPLMLLSPWLPPDLKIEGVTNATAELQFQVPDQLLGHANIELPPGTVAYPLLEGESDRRDYRSGQGKITMNSSGLQATADIIMSNDDRFHGQAILPDAKLLSLNHKTQPIQASAQLKVHDPGFIETIIPEVHDMRGEIEVNLSVAGTLSQPQLSGRANLLKGALRIPRLGLTLDQLSLKSQSDDFEKLNFSLNSHSGEGNLAIQGQTTLDRSAGWPTQVNVKGKEFLISNIPEARVLVSPDLQIKIQKHVIDIQGSVHIPSAKLQPKDLATAARASKDAVIIGSQEKPEEKWSIFTQVRISLGEQVNFYGFGFEGRFGGSLLLTDKPGQLTTASGELSIPEGHYRAYGQRLDVEHGRLLYTGGPLSNPGLDMRAVRHINEVTAGLKVRGSLDLPQIELFSIPSMGQTDTLSYLLLGRPIENASGEEGEMMAKAALALGLSGGNRLARSLTDQFGLDEMRVESSDKGDQASLVMGRYLSPRLYVSYGVGLIEAFNTFTVRYKIADKWHLKGESGEHQGADIMYTIER